MSDVLTRATLDKAHCASPGCDHSAPAHVMHLESSCHPGAPVQVAYELGALHITCAGRVGVGRCGRMICSVLVAP